MEINDFVKLKPRDHSSRLEIFEKQEHCRIDRAVAGSDDLRNRQLGSKIMRTTEISKRKKEKKRECMTVTAKGEGG